MDTTIVFTHNPAVNYYFSSPAIIPQEEQSIPGIVHFTVKTQPYFRGCVSSPIQSFKNIRR
jgi:hypothetical protein